MRKILAASAIMVLAAACSAGAQPNQHRASGQNGQRDFQVGDFHGIQVRGTQDVVVAVGGAPSVRAEGDTAALEGLEIAVEDGTLKIGTRHGWSWRGPGGHVTVHVTVPSLDAASITGTGDMRIDTVQAQTFQASVTGTGNLAIAALRAGNASFSITGTGDVTAAGTAERADVSLTGTGNVDLGTLAVRRAQVEMMGPGDVTLRASEAVEGAIMGPGDLTVRGGARCSVSRSGPGSVRCEA